MRVFAHALALVASVLYTLAPALAQAPQTTTNAYPRLQYLRPETGAVPRTVDARLKDTIHAADFGIKCNGQDETTKFAALAAAIGPGQKTVYLPRGSCTMTSWNLNGKRNLRLLGEGGLDMDNANPATELVCTATGAAICFNFTNTKGFLIENMAFAYSDPNMTGLLIDMHAAASTWTKNKFSNVTMYQKGAATYSADRLIYIYESVDVTFEKVRFSHANYGIVGGNSGIDAQSTASMRCFSCDFVFLKTAAILNPGLNWSIISSNFEPSPSGAPSGITYLTGNPMKGLNIVGSTFSDAVADGTWIFANDSFSMNITGSTFAGNGSANITAIRLGGAITSGINIAGNLFSFVRTGINFTGSAGTCAGVSVTGNSFQGSTTAVIGQSNCDNNSLFDGNTPPIGLAKSVTSGGTGLNYVPTDSFVIGGGNGPLTTGRGGIDYKGHYQILSGTPSALGCGGGGSGMIPGSTDAAGAVAVGSTPVTSCYVVFNGVYSGNFFCTVTSRDGAPFSYGPNNNNQLQINFASAAGRIFDYHCMGS